MEEGVQCDGSGKAGEDSVSGGGNLERNGDGDNVGLSGKAKAPGAKKEKRRPRLILTDTDSDEDLVSPAQKVCHGAGVDGKEDGDAKKDNVMDGKKDIEGAETERRRVLEKLWKSKMDCFNGGARIDRKKINAGSLKRKQEITDASDPCIWSDAEEVDRKTHKVPVTERKRCKADSSTFKQDIELCREKVKTESGKSKEETSGLFGPLSSRKDDEIGRIVKTGNERKRNRVQDDEEVLQKNIKIENWKSVDRKSKSNSSRPFDPRLTRSTAQWKETESERGKGTAIDKKMLYKKSGPVINRNRETETFDKKRFMLNKGRNFNMAGTSKDNFSSSCDKVIRVQGKGGVLKLSSNKKTKVGGLEKYHQKKEKEKGSVPVNNSNRKLVMDSASVHGRSRFHDKSSSSFVLSKNHLHLCKGSTVRKNRAHGSKTEEDDMTLHTETKNIGTSGIKEEEVKSKTESRSELEIPPPTEKKKAGRGGEKKLLCDKIRNILLNSGWTIDYRPRKSRDYKDAVYISPSGTEHWSITKAYYAFQKELKCEDSSLVNLKKQQLPGTQSGSDHKIMETNSVLPMIPEELLSILKRQRVKKSERAVDKTLNKGGHRNVKKVSKTKFTKSNTLKEKLNSSFEQDGKSPNGGISEIGRVGSKMKGSVRRPKSSSFTDEDGFGNGEFFLSDSHSSHISIKGEIKLIRAQKPSFTSDASLLQGRKKKKRRGSALLARNTSKGANTDADDFVPYPGKRTLLSWLIDLGTVCEKTKVEYMNKKRKRAILKGWITRDGIHCSCCSKILSALKFEVHAGSKLSQPFENIFVETGESLLQCLLDAWDKEVAAEQSGYLSIDVSGDDPNDDTCGICGDGGDLICCDSCPSTFHQCCLNMQMLPPGEWHCSNCSCRFCGGGVCSISHNDGITVSGLLSCGQCEGKYHRACVPETDAVPVSSNNPDTSFCGRNCRKLYDRLQKLLGVRHNLDAGFSWMLVHRFDKDSATSSLGLAQRAVCNSKVSVAAAVMDECFFPIVDRRSGVNIIRNVLYNRGSNFNRLNYSSFYTVVLERGDEIVSAASIRIRGTRLAEMPFIGTRDMYRRQGLCRRLLNAIEMALSSLDVEMLVIPAISELTHAWTEVFGFKALEESHRDEMRSMNMMVFPEIDMLQKPLCRGDGIVTADADMKVIDRSCHSDMNEVAKASQKAFSVGPVSENGTIHDAIKAEREEDAAEPPLHTFGCSSREGTECDNEPQNKPTTSPDPVLHDTDLAQEKTEVENQSLMASVNSNQQSVGDDTLDIVQDNHNVSNEVCGVEPSLHSFGVNSVRCTSEATISDSPDDFSGSSFQASLGSTVQNNNEWLVKPHEAASDASSFLASDGTQHETPPFEVDVTCDVKVDMAATEPIVYTFCDEAAQCTSEFIPQSVDAVSEYKLQASGRKPHESGEESIVTDLDGIKIGVSSVEQNQHAFGDAPAVCTLYC